ncbi:PREDICTED: stabilin-2 [Gekko japonicus]|uniref:Stabilin-2 n=1 Tax=Gekko japonicus TaxID=146911 RepID=A0ABM1KWF5_GEKJA|nr:PREDICTED: stabilin-2 [Gekko japonicus]
MEKNLTVLFLVPSLIASAYSAIPATEQGKNKCDEKTFITTKTQCRPCSLNYDIQCPEGFTRIANGSGTQDCRFYGQFRGDSVLSFLGCQHTCMKENQQPQCCPGYWGPDCLECPGGAASPCNNRGHCSQGITGNGVCTCQKGFAGVACETCDKDLFGPLCMSVCHCIHGICNSGMNGDGKCTCLFEYKGPSCDQPIPECRSLQCPENSRCTVSKTDKTQLECKCLPSYREEGKYCKPINPCLEQVCDPRADCIYLGPNRHTCACQNGYDGDGQVCTPIEPCHTKSVHCPTESTVCKYDGPGKSHCECKEHFSNFVDGEGCSMTDICASNNPCHKYAMCTMIAPGKTQCACQKGYGGNGFVCYRNIIDQIRDMNSLPGGQWQGKLTSAVQLFGYAYERQLSTLGPFTVLVPTNEGFKGKNMADFHSNKQSAQYFVKLHIIPGQLDLSELNNSRTVYTLSGKLGDILNEKDNLLRIRIQGGKKKGKILQGGIPACNGIVHIIDTALDNMEPTFEGNEEKSIMKVLQDKTRYSTFISLIEKTGMGPSLDKHPGPNTVFIPTNSALENLEDGVLDYLLSSKGSRKLHELVQHHIVPRTQLEVASLISTGLIKTMTQQFIYFNITKSGQILVNGQAIEEGDIVAENGRIYILSGVLMPPSIIPVLPQRCDEERTEIVQDIASSKCIYYDHPFVRHGCAKYCNVTIKEPKCCKGFFGPDCNKCPGDISSPCSGNGQCMDGMNGNGTCVCNSGFEGSLCQFCSDSTKYGPQCDTTCMCVYGKCDNRIDSDGTCLPGSCKSGYAGKLCDMQVFPCMEMSQLCNGHCLFSNGSMSCACKPGYEGDGIICSEVDPCGNSTFHRCSTHADCVVTGPGTHECVCQPGWTGNGRDCLEINNCLLPSAGDCHSNATCLHTGPGQNKCECKERFRGNGYECESINPCLEQNETCHPLAICQLSASRVWECVCPKGYEGDGRICYGNAVDALSSLSEAAGFKEWVDTGAITALLTDMSNLTIFVPSRQAIENMDQDERAVWMSKSNIPALIKSHILDGTYTVADFQNMSLSDDLHDNSVPASRGNENLIARTNIVAGDIVATNGIIHIIDKVLTPRRRVRSSTPPKLLVRLEQMPDYTIFRGYIIQYNLASEIEAAGTYTIFAPDDYAIKSYLKDKQLTSLDEDQIRFHIVLEEKLFKNDLHNGMFRDTMLGFSFRVGFFIHDAQVYINDAPVNYPNVATEKGIIHGLGKVMEIKKNRCDTNDTVLITEGSRQICFYYKPYERTMEKGCRVQCAKTVITRECCAGFYGTQCEPCPQVAGNICFGNGICMDGFNGTGFCECEAGFKGLACDSCIEGKYGTNCDQECICIHGKCNSGIKGDGSCECDVGWRGVKCDTEAKDDNCNKTCHTSANCLLNPKGTSYCKCAAGFKGNGTHCTAIDGCEISNGGCSPEAECRRTTPGNRVCACKTGYTGDGIVCLEINPCITNNGGCDKNAECTHIGPNQAACNCLKGYSGNGNTCTYISLCSINNGGCGENAICNDTEGTERSCACKPSYIGDGFTCRGSIIQELSRDFNMSRFKMYLQDAGIQDMEGAGPFTVFVPHRKAVQVKISDWVKNGMMPQILRNHIVACSALLYDDLTADKNVTTLQGEQLKITISQNSIFLNSKAKILTSDIISTNGIIHIIDSWLIPQRIQDFATSNPATERESLKMVAAKNGYIMFANLLESAGLFGFLNDPAHQPITLFWPTDKVVRALPAEQQDFLFKMSNKEKLQQYLKFHIIRDVKIPASALPTSSSLTTVQGFDISVTCSNYNNEIGELYVNDRSCKIVQRYLEFDGGVAYGIDCILTDPNLGGRCDTFISHDVSGDCGSCYRTPKCPAGAKVKGQQIYPCTYNSYGRLREGCQRNCSVFVRVPQCCKGYFGYDCQACPGGPEAPCNSRGSCDEGYSGTGQCTCYGGFNGTSCEFCLPGRYGPDCRFCQCTENGQCDEGISGSGLCICETGWTGKFCETKLDVAPVCSPSCSINAVCKAQNICQCKLFYIGDGITCTAMNLCKISNGGCHKNARCSQSGVKVNCTCQKGYKGDGRICTAINSCTDGFNGGCHEHAICTKTGPGKRKCECKDNYIGDGIDCEVKQLRVNRCLQDNGQCHADADCVDLHFEDATAGVFHLRSPQGQYKLTFDEANKACADEGATLATYNQLLYAQKAKYHLCAAGWLQSGRVGYPTAFSAPTCGGGLVGIIDYGIKLNQSETWDAFCYRVKDVNCTCRIGYVGDGFTCTGNLLQVLMSVPTFTNFVSEIFTYSNTSRKGQEFLKYLTNLSIKATLFVPDNDGLKENETLSGRDIEYHLSNMSILYYEDLTNGTTLQTRIGKKLLITHGENQEKQASATRYVDGRAILGWDVVASNGIIHVIAAPLKAPLPPAILHLGVGTGIFFAVLLIIGIIALIGYTYFRFKQGDIRFQRFKQKNDIDVTTLGTAQASNISNINYDGSRTSPPDLPYDPFSDSDVRELVTNELPAEL